MFAQLMFEFMIIGLIGGLLGIFYRNCLKVEEMKNHILYEKVFKWMVFKGTGFTRWIAYPLGFCCYCSTFWITMLLLILFLTSWESLPKWQDIVIGIVAAEGVQHLVICIACKWLIHKHPDLDKHYLEHLHE